MFRLLAFALPLGVESFAMAAALGAAGLTGTQDRFRVSLIFVVFEAGMSPITRSDCPRKCGRHRYRRRLTIAARYFEVTASDEVA
jgi:hypothetical protein